VFLAKVAVAVTLLAIVVGLTMGVSATWLTAGVVHKVTRLALVIAAGAVVYFGTLYALGFRLAQFNRRDAIEAPDVVPADDGEP
jgi:putative peptidoglycan lipid II flippase